MHRSTMMNYPFNLRKMLRWYCYARNVTIGSLGERAAHTFCKRSGMWVIARNWGWKHLEADIIALHGRTLIFLEVKTRKKTHRSAFPGHTAINAHKRSSLQRASAAFVRSRSALLRRHGVRRVQIDLIEVYYSLSFFKGFVVQEIARSEGFVPADTKID